MKVALKGASRVIPDQHLQDRVLRRLAREYPNRVEVSTLGALDTPETQRALFYLYEKGFVEAGYISERPGQPREMLEAKITARGMEALVGVRDTTPQGAHVVVPFEIDALRHFFKRSIEGSAIADSKKQRAIERLMGFSDADVKALLVRLVHQLAERPDALIDSIESTGK